jgi:hypothetical protein
MPTLSAIPGALQEWQATWDGATGVWPLSGTMYVDIPNNPVANPYKDIWVQLTWEPQAIGNVPTVWETDSSTYGSLVNQQALSGGWIHSTYLIHLVPNPDSELVRIDGGIMVDQLVIDTICVPEPGSLALLALGGVAWLLRRR